MATFLTEAEKQFLLDHYFDIEWCDDVSGLRCVRCHRVAINHLVSNCQHIFCKTCQTLYSKEPSPNCPQCQESITKLDDHDFDVEVKIHQLKIFCPNKKYGCKHADQLRRIPSHLLFCTNTREATLSEESPVAIDEIIEERMKEVEKKIDDNERKLKALTKKMKRLDNRVEEILQSIMPPMQLMARAIGENKALIEKKMSSSEEMVNKMASMNHIIEGLVFKTSEQWNHLEDETCKWTVRDVKRNTLTANWRLVSGAFRFTGYQYEIRAKLEKEAEILHIYLKFNDGDTMIPVKHKYEFTNVTYIVRDQRTNKNKKDIIIEAELGFNEGRYDWAFRKRLPDEILSSPYMKDDCIKISIILKPPSIDRNFVSNNGVLLWRVDNYKTRKQEWFHYGVCSPTFYTSPRGYRVKTQLLIDHEGFLSLKVLFLTGEHDFKLSQDFRHATTVTLYNPVDPSKTLVTIKRMDHAECYTIPFEINTIVEQNDFIYYDLILLKIVIEPVTNDVNAHLCTLSSSSGEEC